MLNWKALSTSLTGQTSQSIAHQRYTPGTTATTSTSSATAHGSTATTPLYYSGSSGASSVRAHGGSSDTILTTRHDDPLWVVFGIKDTNEYDEIENIEVSNLPNDSSFFKELKKRYTKHRWFFQRWFSPFRFRYCDFVQVNILSDDYGFWTNYTSLNQSTLTKFTVSGKLCRMNVAIVVIMNTVQGRQGRETHLLDEISSPSASTHVTLVAT